MPFRCGEPSPSTAVVSQHSQQTRGAVAFDDDGEARYPVEHTATSKPKNRSLRVPRCRRSSRKGTDVVPSALLAWEGGVYSSSVDLWNPCGDHFSFEWLHARRPWLSGDYPIGNFSLPGTFPFRWLIPVIYLPSFADRGRSLKPLDGEPVKATRYPFVPLDILERP
jgi:hypothetical protein